MIFETLKQSTDNRTFTHHKVISRKVNMLDYTITVIVRSYPNLEKAIAESSDNVEFIVAIPHIDYHESYLSNIENQIKELEWQPYRRQPVMVSINPSFEALKLDKIKQINLHRDSLEKKGFPYLDKIIDSDIISVVRISIAAQSAQIALVTNTPFEIDWATQDNTILTLDAQGMMGMSVALAEYANSLHLHSRAKKDLIDAATTQEELEAIVW